jgi:type I restriction enzyme, S subunit
MAMNSRKFRVPKEWDVVRLGDIAAIKTGGTPSRAKPEYWDPTKATTNRWVTIKDMAGKWVDETAEHISDAGIENSSVKLIEPGTLLMSFKLTIGKVAFARKPLFTNEAIAAILPSDHTSPEFLYHALPSVTARTESDAAIKGRTLNQDKINALRILLPPLAEQARITAVLGTVDEAVERGRAVLAQTKTLRQALLHTLLTRGLPDRNTEFKTVRLGDIYSERSEHGIPGLPVMSVTNNGMVVRSTTDRRVESDLSDEGHALVRKDDIAYNMMRMWQGVSCLADRDCLVSPAYVVCSPRKGIVPQYGAYLLKAPHVVQLLRLHSQGVHEDRLRLYYKHFAPIRVEIPDEDTQRSSVRMIASLDARVAAAESHLAALEQVKAALSAALLTGEVRVPMKSRREEVRRG